MLIKRDIPHIFDIESFITVVNAEMTINLKSEENYIIRCGGGVIIIQLAGILNEAKTQQLNAILMANR